MIRASGIMVFIVVLLHSCAKDEGPFYTDGGGTLPDSLDVSFAKDVQPIFNSYCVSCHKVSHSKLALIEGMSYNELMTDGAQAPYVNVSNPEASILMGYLNGQPTFMPPTGTIPEFEKQIILKWIKDGAKNN